MLLLSNDYRSFAVAKVIPDLLFWKRGLQEDIERKGLSMSNIKGKIKSFLQIGDPLSCSAECYFLKKRRFLVFYDSVVSKGALVCIANEIMKSLQDAGIEGGYNNSKTIIVVAPTNDEFKPVELELFDNENNVVTFYLINCDTHKRFYVKGPGPFIFGLSYTKFIKQIDKAVEQVWGK